MKEQQVNCRFVLLVFFISFVYAINSFAANNSECKLVDGKYSHACVDELNSMATENSTLAGYLKAYENQYNIKCKLDPRLTTIVTDSRIGSVTGKLSYACEASKKSKVGPSTVDISGEILFKVHGAVSLDVSRTQILFAE